MIGRQVDLEQMNDRQTSDQLAVAIGLDPTILADMAGLLLPCVSVARVVAVLSAAPGDELRDKFASSESSSARAVNAFG